MFPVFTLLQCPIGWGKLAYTGRYCQPHEIWFTGLWNNPIVFRPDDRGVENSPMAQKGRLGEPAAGNIGCRRCKKIAGIWAEYAGNSPIRTETDSAFSWKDTHFDGREKPFFPLLRSSGGWGAMLYKWCLPSWRMGGCGKSASWPKIHTGDIPSRSSADKEPFL